MVHTMRVQVPLTAPHADVAELADALDSGSSGSQPCRFKSCHPHQKRQSERVAFFHATADLKQNCVLSANCIAFVCPCTLCGWRNALQVNLLAYAITLAPLTTSLLFAQ